MMQSVEINAKDGRQLIHKGDAIVLEYLKPTRFYLDIKDGQIVGARQMLQL